MSATALKRYHSVAIILHWIMAIAFLLMLGSGLVMTSLELSKSLKFSMYQWHKSLGVVLLLTFFVRIAWRLFHKPPALPARIKGLEAFAAKAGHWALYACMLIMPLSGWVIVSASVYGLPTIVFGWFEWPHIPDLTGNMIIKEGAEEVHEIMAWIFIALIAGHVAAVIKHAVIDKENIAARMWWSK